jgi:hypothetical protein
MSDKAASEPLRHIEPSIDQRQALESAAARLHSEFADTLNLETIEWFPVCAPTLSRSAAPGRRDTARPCRPDRVHAI